jgi:hypothetical protein
VATLELIAVGDISLAGPVLGHHPLVIQGIESHHGRLIAYSPGSFQFKPRTAEARRSFILRATIGPREVKRHNLIPVHIGEESTPRPVWKTPRRETLRFVRQVSAPIAANVITERRWLEQAAAVHLRRNLEAWSDRIRRYGFRHLMQFMRWLVDRFTIRCCLGLMRRQMKSWVGLHD